MCEASQRVGVAPVTEKIDEGTDLEIQKAPTAEKIHEYIEKCASDGEDPRRYGHGTEKDRRGARGNATGDTHVTMKLGS